MAFPGDFFPNLDFTSQSALHTIFLPFLLIFTIIFGTLSIRPIFNKRINLLIAIVLALASTQTPVFFWFSTVLPAYGSITAVAGFVIIFFFGVIMWAYKRGEDIYIEAGGIGRKINKLYKQKEKLEREYDKAIDQHNDSRAVAISERIERIEREIKHRSYRAMRH